MEMGSKPSLVVGLFGSCTLQLNMPCSDRVGRTQNPPNQILFIFFGGGISTYMYVMTSRTSFHMSNMSHLKN
uniref:Uncharacterized protein n=1 Tax=Oryza nivara TaxID=4536 RepID=A0A0E0IL34_ORYNI